LATVEVEIVECFTDGTPILPGLFGHRRRYISRGSQGTLEENRLPNGYTYSVTNLPAV